MRLENITLCSVTFHLFSGLSQYICVAVLSRSAMTAPDCYHLLLTLTHFVYFVWITYSEPAMITLFQLETWGPAHA